jgi:hypothetical protein
MQTVRVIGSRAGGRGGEELATLKPIEEFPHG